MKRNIKYNFLIGIITSAVLPNCFSYRLCCFQKLWHCKALCILLHLYISTVRIQNILPGVNILLLFEKFGLQSFEQILLEFSEIAGLTLFWLLRKYNPTTKRVFQICSGWWNTMIFVLNFSIHSDKDPLWAQMLENTSKHCCPCCPNNKILCNFK